MLPGSMDTKQATVTPTKQSVPLIAIMMEWSNAHLWEDKLQWKASEQNPRIGKWQKKRVNNGIFAYNRKIQRNPIKDW